MNIIKSTILINIILFSQVSHGIITNESVYPNSEADFAQLPVFCRARLTNDKNLKNIWGKKLGPNFIHVHHFCFGLHKMQKAQFIINKKERDHALQNAISEMVYVQEHASKSFILQTQVSYYIGQMYELMGNSSKAIGYYIQSIKLNPKPALAYAALSEIYRKQNNISEAKKVLKLGLKYSPNSKKLNKLISALEKK